MTSIPDSASDVTAQLTKAVRGAVSGGLRRRAEYSSDAGNYRLLPTVVVEPLDVDDVLATLAVSRATGVPVTSRGAGTSVAGNAVGTGIVIDFARHLNRVLEIDSSSQTALVEPGVVMSELQKKVAPLNLRFGPDPSTQNRATLGGMIGNNACGPHALAYGRTADNVAALMLVDGVGRQINTTDGVQQIPGLEAVVQSRLEVIRTEFGMRIPHDIAVVGFDNTELAAAPAYDLTTYEQPIVEMVQVMVEMILGRRKKETIYLRGRFVPRSSA